MTTDRDILDGLPGLLAELSSLRVSNVRNGTPADRLLRLGPHLIAVVAKPSSRAAAVAQAAKDARAAARHQLCL